MPTLHLPAAHTDTDVALATEVAHVVGSHELYVTWTHGEGPGLPPEVETFTDDGDRSPARSRRSARSSSRWSRASRRCGTRSSARRATRPELPAPRDDRAQPPRSAAAEPTPLADARGAQRRV